MPETTPREMWERDRQRAERAGLLAEWVELRQRMHSAQAALRACPPYGCPKTSAALSEVGAIQREQRKLTREVDRILRLERRSAS